MNIRRILLSLAVLVFAGGVVAGGTGAFFSDSETSSGNVFAAGAIDLTVDSVSHINGLVCFEDQWVPETEVTWNAETGMLEEDGNIANAIPVYNADFPSNIPQAGDDCTGTWTLTDLGPTHTFFDFGDLKPGDSGENTISLHLETNDGYACAIIDNLVDDDNGLTEPEEEDGDDTGGDGEGELSTELHFFAWADTDGDNIWDDNEIPLFNNENKNGPAYDVLGGRSYELYTPDTLGEMPANSTAYVGLYWCYGTIGINGNTLSCDGSDVTNLTQTDSMTADFTFYVEQARNNDEFECPEPGTVQDDVDSRVFVGADLAEYIAPDTCDAEVSGTESIQTAVDDLVSGGTVCVVDDYDMTGDDNIITIINPDVTLVALTQGTALDVPVKINADNVTVTGFTGSIGAILGQQAAFYIVNGSDNFEVSYNTINGSGVGAGIMTETGATYVSGLIANNVLDGATQGMYLNPFTGGTIIVEYNDISNNLAGIGGFNGAIVRYNEFTHTTPGSEAIGVDSSFDANPGTVNYNNFLDGTMLNTYGVIASTIDAEDNFFSDGGASQVGSGVDFTPETLAAYPQN